MNPYVSFLADHDPLVVIDSTARRLSEIVAKVPPASLEWRPAPGKWNAREILCHLADCEIAFAFRLRQTLAESHHIIQPFDQEKWAGTYGGLTASGALNAFSALRHWDVELITSIPADAMAKLVTHPERGDMTFRVIVETMAGHDINHLLQLEKIAAAFEAG
jgi:DinB superfamily